MITLNRNWFQNCYCRFIATLVVTQIMMDSNKQEMQIIISLSVIQHYVHYFHLNLKIPSRYKVMCDCECCISAKIIHSLLLSWRYRYLEKLKDQSKNSQNRRSRGKANRIYETYKNTVMPHGCHIYAKASDMAKSKMCAYPQSDHALPHCKCVLRCYVKCPSINIPDQETDDHYSNTSPSIRFHIYHLIPRCTTHGRLPLTFKKTFCIILFQNNPSKYTLEKS